MDKVYTVLVNEEGQYSIWLKSLQVPDGWESEGFEGSEEQCLEHVNQTWVDMRPLSARKT